MKKLIFTIILSIVIPLTAQSQTFVDTALTAPLEVVPMVTVLRQYSFLWGPESFTVQYNLLAADGSIVEQRACVLDGEDFTTGDGAKVLAGAVGKTYKSVIAAYLQGKCKGKWSLTGTE
ncbi:MAG TPA: hypothetical protein DCZ63_09110 [Geobacter sp.]|nr:hypothetical protein [Geobacter sp.]